MDAGPGATAAPAQPVPEDGDDEVAWHQRVVFDHDGVTIIDELLDRYPSVGEGRNVGWGLGLCHHGAYRRRARGVDQIVDSNTGFLRADGDEIVVAPIADTSMRVTFINVDPHTLSIAAELAAAPPQLMVTTELDLLHRRLARAQLVGADPLQVQSIVLSMVGAAAEQRHDDARSHSRRTTETAHRAIVADACERLHVADAELGLFNLARSVGCSPFHLSRVFREVTGVTITEYRKQLRVRRALAQLDRGDEASLATIAAETGFSDHSHMTRAFVEHYGHPPSTMRRLLTKQLESDPLRWTGSIGNLPLR